MGLDDCTTKADCRWGLMMKKAVVVGEFVQGWVTATIFGDLSGEKWSWHLCNLHRYLGSKHHSGAGWVYA